jgi:hypothetical protein
MQMAVVSKIEKNIPLPADRQSQQSWAFLADMEVGDSVSAEGSQNTITRSLSVWKKKLPDRKFTCRKTSDHNVYRIWRTA